MSPSIFFGTGMEPRGLPREDPSGSLQRRIFVHSWLRHRNHSSAIFLALYRISVTNGSFLKQHESCCLYGKADRFSYGSKFTHLRQLIRRKERIWFLTICITINSYIDARFFTTKWVEFFNVKCMMIQRFVYHWFFVTGHIFNKQRRSHSVTEVIWQ